VEQFVLREPAQFKALGHALRHRLLMVLRQGPATLAQLASAVRAAKGTVAYHIKVLQEADLVRVARSRPVRGGTEVYFEPVSAALRIAGDAPVGGEFLVNAALGEMVEPNETLLHHVRLTPRHAEELAGALVALVAGLVDDAEGEPHGVLLSVYRADVPVLPPM
jgi:DNA-binding transcriptional ArsR family regulator